jgi:uncharacterized protein YjhX (UPF0386 family)
MKRGFMGPNPAGPELGTNGKVEVIKNKGDKVVSVECVGVHGCTPIWCLAKTR